MKRILFLALGLFSFGNQAYSQGVAFPSNAAMQSTRYSGASVNESSGRIATTIPVYNYEVGRLSVPVMLNYTGNGVKVSQQSNWVGTNWNLSAGGVITRIVNYLPDEKANTRVFKEEIEAMGSQFNPANYPPYPTGNSDIEADIFSFNFAGYSGQFYLDKNKQPKLISNNSEIKIAFQNGVQPTDNNVIVITTPDGVRYYFGGEDASEISGSFVRQKRNGQQLIPAPSVEPGQIPSTDTKAVTAFYLFKIENNYNDVILFEYHSEANPKTVTFFRGQELAYIAPNEYPAGCNFAAYNGLRDLSYIGQITKMKKIKRIYSALSDLEVRFTSENAYVLPAVEGNDPEYDDRILNSIHVYNNLTTKYQKNFFLSYLSPLNGKNSYRFFLEKVASNTNSDGSSTGNCEVFKMEYNSPNGLPSRSSFAVDLLGYANGVLGNTTLIAQNQNIVFDNAFGNLALRESNFTYASLGTLTKIFYPTGGYTQFEYEAPSVRANVGQRIPMETYRNISNRIPQSKTSVSYAIDGGFDPITGQELPFTSENHQMTVVLDAAVLLPTGQSGTYHQDKVIVEVTDNTTGQVQSQPLSLVLGTLNYHRIYYFDLIKDHKYTVVLKQDPISPDANRAPISANLVLYFNKFQTFEAAGIRVKKISDVMSDTENTVKRYYYQKMDSSEESAIVTYEPAQQISYDQISCPEQGTGTIFYIATLMGSPLGQFFAGSDNQTEYKYVTISYGGDNFEEGGVEKHFKIDKNNKAVPLNTISGTNFSKRDNYGENNGMLLREIEIKPTDAVGVYQKTREKIYDYEIAVNHELNNIVQEATNPYAAIQASSVFGTYKTFSFGAKLKSVTSKEYIGYVGKNSDGPAVTQTVEYEYGSLRGLPVKITAKKSNAKSAITKLYYAIPSDIALMSGLTTAQQQAYTTLYNQNSIVTPVQTEQYIQQVNGSQTLLGTQRTVFATFNGMTLPEKTLSAKGTAAFKSLSAFTAYDFRGNPTEVTDATSLKKSIIYGYKGRFVIAELLNVAYADIPPFILGDIQDQSNNVVDNTNAQNLQNALNSLRTMFPKGQVTTMVYNEKGLQKSVTDASGNSMSYEYDDCQRVRVVKDKDGNVIKETRYNLINN